MASRKTRAYPHRDQLGRINVRAQATAAIKDAISAGKRFMSVEFRAIDERTTKAGVREILSAFVDKAAHWWPARNTTPRRLRCATVRGGAVYGCNDPSNPDCCRDNSAA